MVHVIFKSSHKYSIRILHVSMLALTVYNKEQDYVESNMVE